jgi:hypothetical protein
MLMLVLTAFTKTATAVTVKSIIGIQHCAINFDPCALPLLTHQLLAVAVRQV